MPITTDVYSKQLRASLGRKCILSDCPMTELDVGFDLSTVEIVPADRSDYQGIEDLCDGDRMDFLAILGDRVYVIDTSGGYSYPRYMARLCRHDSASVIDYFGSRGA